METQPQSSNLGSKLRWLLIVDGILIFLVCIVLLVRFVPEILGRYISRPRFAQGPIVGNMRTEAIKKGVAIQDIQLSSPRKLPRSGVWVIEIAQRDLEEEKRMRRSFSLSDFSAGGQYLKPPEFLGLSGRPTVNLLLFSERNPGGFLLFDRQVLIGGIVVPSHQEDPQNYILYTVVIADDDNDGRLTPQDNRSLWMSDLDGQGLTQITADSLALDSFSFEEDKQAFYLVTSINPNNKKIPREHWEQALFVFDVKDKKLTPLPIAPSNLQQARSFLQK